MSMYKLELRKTLTTLSAEIANTELDLRACLEAEDHASISIIERHLNLLKEQFDEIAKTISSLP